MLDARPFEDLHHIVQDFHDDRIWVFAEWVSAACLAAGKHLARTWGCKHDMTSMTQIATATRPDWCLPLPHRPRIVCAPYPAALLARLTRRSSPRLGWSGRRATTARCTT